MIKTYVATVPDRIGAFLMASRLLGGLGINITRVSYNKAVDSNTLFLDVEGSEEQLLAADKALTEIGYLTGTEKEPEAVLLEFKLRDVPGSVTAVLELLAGYNLYITYISSRAEDGDYQYFKMALSVDNRERLESFLGDIKDVCEVREVEFNRSERVFDNSVFYESFVSSLIKAGGISEEYRDELLVNSNLAMQMLDERGMTPYQTFDSISKFADMLARCRGEAFTPRITHHRVSELTEITLIEPPCGSNTAIIKSGSDYLFVDCGYTYYEEEMLSIFRRLIPNWDSMEKRVLITHADQDHCGLIHLFDRVIVSRKTAESLRMEYEGNDSFREHNSLHRPYIRICKALTKYRAPDPSRFIIPWSVTEPQSGALWQIGFLEFGDLTFEVYEGRGGHVVGEIVLIDYEHNIVFSGDIFVNLKGMTSEQKQYNKYAPMLMTSVDTEKTLAAKERLSMLARLGKGSWRIFGGHGAVKEYETDVKQ